MKLCCVWMRPWLHPDSSECKHRLKGSGRSWNEANYELFSENLNSYFLNFESKSKTKLWLRKVSQSQLWNQVVECLCVSPVLHPIVSIQHKAMMRICFDKWHFWMIFKMLRLPSCFNAEGILVYQCWMNIFVFVHMCYACMQLCLCVHTFVFIHRCSSRKIMSALEITEKLT